MIAVGIGVQAFSSIMEGAAAKQHGEAVRDADFRSADAADRAAADATERGNLKDLQVAMHGSAVVAEQRVIQSGSGADVNIGAPKATQEATQAVSDVDRVTVRRNAALEAYGLRGHARALRQHGVDAKAEGDNAMVGTFLGGIANVVGKGGRWAADQAPTSSSVPTNAIQTPEDGSYGGNA